MPQGEVVVVDVATLLGNCYKEEVIPAARAACVIEYPY